jgi:hypothetical protein
VAKDGTVPPTYGRGSGFSQQQQKGADMSVFKKATKSQAKLRAAIFGPSGAGKTFSSLRIATGLGGKIAVIDTERGSAAKYADLFSFDVAEPADKTIDAYVETIKSAHGYDVLVIDSLSHAWAELLAEIDRLANAKFRGNTWSAWSEGTPKQRRLVDAILDFPGHVIATMRSKTEWQTASDSSGKSRPVRVGLAPEQGKGIEYEFDVLFEISPEHIVHVIKDRSGRFQDKTIDRPDEEFGKALAAWLSDAPPAAEDADLVDKAKAAIVAAETVEKLEQIRRLVSERVREGKFHQATADQLVKDILARVEEIGTEVEAVS